MTFATKSDGSGTPSPKLTAKQADNVRANVERHLADERFGRRDLKWLASASGINYSTLWIKITKATRPLTIDEEMRLARALGLKAGTLRRAPHRARSAAAPKAAA